MDLQCALRRFAGESEAAEIKLSTSKSNHLFLPPQEIYTDTLRTCYLYSTRYKEHNPSAYRKLLKFIY